MSPYDSKGFTKLETILIVIILGLLGFLGFKNFTLTGIEAKNENGLKNKAIYATTLSNNRDWINYYDQILPAQDKQIITKEKFAQVKQDYLQKNNIFKTSSIVNSVTVEGNDGYVDRTITECYSEDCSKQQARRNYSKWIFEKTRWYQTTEVTSCIRKQPYDKPAEFDRAISLVFQRINDSMGGDLNSDFTKCLDIAYGKLDDEEGIFRFENNGSSLGKYEIVVDESYKSKDDLLTAYLLSHEIAHALNYINKNEQGIQISCMDDEISAFMSQFRFLAALNDGEKVSLDSRLVTDHSNRNIPLLMVRSMAKFSGNAYKKCGRNNPSCYSQSIIEQISSMVKSNPYYQKECSGRN